MAILKCANINLDLSETQVMGILNVTPDSFSDGGCLLKDQRLATDVILNKARKMIASGATILDLGGESTRPNAQPVSEAEEMDRVLPALELLKAHTDIVISIDTSNAKLMTEAAKLGAGMLNDVRALEREGALQAAADTGLPVCLMHMQGSPEIMQQNPSYSQVAVEVLDYLQGRAERCQQLGIGAAQIILDPGIGFGKSLAQNLQLLAAIKKFSASGYPILIGTSRKSMFGQLLQREVGDRLAGSLATVAYAVMQGAAIVRVHDVQETVDVVKVIQAIGISA